MLGRIAFIGSISTILVSFLTGIIPVITIPISNHSYEVGAEVVISKGFYLGLDSDFGRRVLLLKVTPNDQPSIHLIDLGGNGSLEWIVKNREVLRLPQDSTSVDFSWRRFVGLARPGPTQ